MGASFSKTLTTVGGWSVILAITGYYVFRYMNGNSRAARTPSRQRVEDRHTAQNRKENKDKAKRQRGEAYAKDSAIADKAAKTRSVHPVPAAQNVAASYSSDDGHDNREFAQQLARVTQGVNLNATKKSEQNKQKSVKQSKANQIGKAEAKTEKAVSVPSSTAGVDADDDESPITSPEVKAKDAGDVADMLEPKAAGPASLRLTGVTEKTKKPKKTAKEPEPTETKKQRQNRQKKEAEKAARAEAETERQKIMEKQRRDARIAEGRAAKDGSTFTAAQKQPNAWAANGTHGNKAPVNGLSNGDFSHVQPLDTVDSSIHADASVEESAPAVKPVKSVNKAKTGSWMSSLPSEEEQMEMLRKEEEWSTVTTKKSTRKPKQPAAETEEVVESAVNEPQQMTPVVSAPVVTKTQKPSTNGKPAFVQKSSFAALSVNDTEPEVEEEWDI